MNAPHDEAVTERFHCVGENVPRYGLDDVFREFGAVAFDPCPFSEVHPLISYGLRAKLVLADPGLHIGEPPPGRKADEQNAALPLETKTMGVD